MIGRLPRLLRRTGTITALRRNELRVSDSFADYALQGKNKPALVAVFILALVKSERLLIKIPEQVKRFDIHIRSLKCAFKQGPKVLQTVASSMVKLRGNAKTHAPGSPVDEPVHTISADGEHHALSCAYLAQHNAGNNSNPGHPATEPISTVSAKGSQQQVVSASLAAYYGSEADGQPIDEPLRTATAKPRFGMALSEAVTPGLTAAQLAGARRVAKFLRKFGVEFEGEFATVGEFIIVDIGMRMLTPRELFRAQGFPESYVIDRAWLVNPKTGEIVEVKLSKESQIRMCGNSVCPDVAEALVRANNPEMAVWGKDEGGRLKAEIEMAEVAA